MGEGIPIDQRNRPIANGKERLVEESHGWFPKSLDRGFLLSEETLVIGQQIANKDTKDGTKVPARRPSGRDPSIIPASNAPVIVSPNKPSGMSRLPTTDEKREPDMMYPVNHQPPSGMLKHQAKSIATLSSLESGAGIFNIQRTQSSQNITKPSHDKPTGAHKSGKTANNAPGPVTTPAQPHGKLKKSKTTPGTFDDISGKPSRNPSATKTK